jgi:deazaflavin-dependent oxidoreductase (nitroreductase family)
MSDEAKSFTVAYPSSWLLKQAFKMPILMWRMGLGFLVGKLFMIMTATGRKSGQPRQTAIEFHEHAGRKYVFSAFGEKADWYKNILADQRVTIQTASGTEHVIARRIVSERELKEAFEFVTNNHTMKKWVQVLGFRLNLDEFITQKDRFFLITFDPIDEPTPPPLKADLKWIWLVIMIIILVLGWLIIRQG